MTEDKGVVSMNAEDLFVQVGFVQRFRAESEQFYRPYFENDAKMSYFFFSVFKNDSIDKRPRWMMNDIRRFVSLANDIDNIRPARDPLRILFFRICLEALCKDSGSQKSDFFDTFVKPSQYKNRGIMRAIGFRITHSQNMFCYPDILHAIRTFGYKNRRGCEQSRRCIIVLFCDRKLNFFMILSLLCTGTSRSGLWCRWRPG